MYAMIKENKGKPRPASPYKKIAANLSTTPKVEASELRIASTPPKEPEITPIRFKKTEKEPAKNVKANKRFTFRLFGIPVIGVEY
jgi:hypothetical protein